MNHNEFWGVFCVGALACLIIFVLVAAVFSVINTKQWQQEAVRHGAAEYVLNQETGSTTWRWKQ